MQARELLARAESYLEAEGRLLERHLFAALFRGAPRDRPLLALAAYQNDDGGFGHGLLPEERSAESGLAATAFALEQLDALDAFDVELLDPVFKYLTPQRPELHGTVRLAALLLKHGVVHPWLDYAVDYCERALEVYADLPSGTAGRPPDFDTLAPALSFLIYADEAGLSAGAEALRTRIEALIFDWDLVEFDPAAAGARSPLDWAPHPLAPARRMFTADLISRHLAALAESQRSDGGWAEGPVGDAAIGAAGRLERRGCRTLWALRTLRAYRFL